MADAVAPIIVGIDPGTGSSSPTGLAIFDSSNNELLLACDIGSKHKALQHRIKEISDVVEATLMELVPSKRPIIVCIEYFVMKGKGGESLQRLVGSIMGRLPMHFQLEFVQNSTIKKELAGHGQADKTSVAFGVLDYFAKNKETTEHIKGLLLAKNFDTLDALAIGVTGWIKCQK